MKKLLLLSVLLIFTCSSGLFAQDYMKMNKKNLRVEYQKKLNKVDSLIQVLDITYSENQNLQSNLKDANNDLVSISDSLNKSNLEISQLGLEIDRLVKESSDKTDLIKKLMDSISNQKLLIKKYSPKTDEFQIIDFPVFLNGEYSTDCKRKNWTEEGNSLGIYFNNKGGSLTHNIDRAFSLIKKVYFNGYNTYRLEIEDVRYEHKGIYEFNYYKEIGVLTTPTSLDRNGYEVDVIGVLKKCEE